MPFSHYNPRRIYDSEIAHRLVRRDYPRFSSGEIVTACGDQGRTPRTPGKLWPESSGPPGCVRSRRKTRRPPIAVVVCGLKVIFRRRRETTIRHSRLSLSSSSRPRPLRLTAPLATNDADVSSARPSSPLSSTRGSIVVFRLPN